MNEREKSWEQIQQLIQKLNDKSIFLKPNPELWKLIKEYNELDKSS